MFEQHCRIAAIAVCFTLTSFAANAGTIVAHVLLKSPPHPAHVVNTAADQFCNMAHKTEKLMTEDQMVNANGTMGNTLVFISEGVTGKYPAPKTPVVLDQQGCHYVPHVFGVMAGQPILIKNSDATLHNIHPLPKVNTSFNIGMPTKGMTQTRVFAKAEAPFHVKCDVHPWMSGFVGVFEHPFFGVSNDQGVVQIDNLPAGTYTVESWHERLGPKFQKVTISGSERKEVSFTY